MGKDTNFDYFLYNWKNRDVSQSINIFHVKLCSMYSKLKNKCKRNM